AGAVEAAGAAGVGEVEAEEAHVVADRGLAGDRLDDRIEFEVLVLRLHRFERGLHHELRLGSVGVEREHEERGAGALQRRRPAGRIVLARQRPALGVLEADSVLLEDRGHRDTSMTFYRPATTRSPGISAAFPGIGSRGTLRLSLGLGTRASVHGNS